MWKDADDLELIVAESEEAFEDLQPFTIVEGDEPEDGEEIEYKAVDVEAMFAAVKKIEEDQASNPVHMKMRPDWRMFYDNSSARRKDQPVTEGFLKYFPAPVRLVSEVSRLGNEKHNPGEPLHHARNKSGDHLDCAGRHLMDADAVDGDFGIIEAVNAIWRLCAYVQEKCERDYGWPKAPNARGEAE